MREKGPHTFQLPATCCLYLPLANSGRKKACKARADLRNRNKRIGLHWRITAFNSFSMKILPNFSAPVQLTIIYLSDRNIECF